MSKETTITIKISNEILKRIKLLAVEKGTTENEIMVELLNEELERIE